jgi:general L-amino acid transport system permease protein
MTTFDGDLQESRLPPPRRRTILTPGIPWYRDLKVLQIIWQIVFVGLLLAGLVYLFINLAQNLEDSSLSLDFGVYGRRFGAEVTDGLRFDSQWGWTSDFDPLDPGFLAPWVAIWGALSATYIIAGYTQTKDAERAGRSIAISIAILIAVPLFITFLVWLAGDWLRASTMTRALIQGFSNTLRVVLLSLVVSTGMGIVLGIGLLSSNFLVRNSSQIFVEIFRNTPLLIQLLLINRALQEVLPGPRGTITSPASIGPLDISETVYALNVRGLSLPGISSTGTTVIFIAIMYLGFVVTFFVRRWRTEVQDNTGAPANNFRYTLGVLSAFFVVAWLASGGWPLSGGAFSMNFPVQGPFNIEGGWFTSLPFLSLFLGLTLYTSAFIADIVRAGIQSVPYGQIEAARSQGLKNNQVLSLVVLPQALRLIIPPLGNQYVNLGKNSSLGIAVLYFDLYNVVQLANNESGQAVPFFVALMLIYLSLSLSLSFFTNIGNRLTQIRTR